MTLLEMSAEYAERAAALRSRITAIRGLARQELLPCRVLRGKEDRL